MKTIDVFNKYCKILETNQSLDTPSLDCCVFLSFILGIDKKDFLKYKDDDFKYEKLLESMIVRRLCNEPVSKIINNKSFWDYDFYVNNDVLDPRPDTETMIEMILDDYDSDEKFDILDLGTGSGCIILTLLKLFKNSNGIAVDISEKALEIAKLNAHKLNINRINFIESNWNDKINGKFDIIVSNPPYIETEYIDNLSKDVKNFDPRIALDGGITGLDCYNYIAKNIIKNCKENTRIFLEIGYKQANDVINIFEQNNFVLHKIGKDLNGYDRIVSFYLKEL